VEALERAVQDDPKYADAFLELGNAYARVPGQSDRALTQFQRAATLEPRRPDAFINAGNVNIFLGRTDNAESFYKQVLSSPARHAAACVARAAASRALGSIHALHAQSRSCAARGRRCSSTRATWTRPSTSACSSRRPGDPPRPAPPRPAPDRPRPHPHPFSHPRSPSPSRLSPPSSRARAQSEQATPSPHPPHAGCPAAYRAVRGARRRGDAAVREYRRAIALQPNNVHALGNLGSRPPSPPPATISRALTRLAPHLLS
jgi:tetratricopeptide (TPR) repeat protein